MINFALGIPYFLQVNKVQEDVRKYHHNNVNALYNSAYLDWTAFCLIVINLGQPSLEKSLKPGNKYVCMPSTQKFVSLVIKTLAFKVPLLFSLSQYNHICSIKPAAAAVV